jgi:hypothetical protein
VRSLPVFDHAAVMAALDDQRRDRQLTWHALADELHAQSADLNVQLAGPCMCSGALWRTTQRDSMSCQYALILLRWLGRPPEDFLTGPVVPVGATPLPAAGSESRLRFDLPQLHTALNERRGHDRLTWAGLAEHIDCTPVRLTNLRTARLADMGLTMRITQWLGRPAAAFIHPTTW